MILSILWVLFCAPSPLLAFFPTQSGPTSPQEVVNRFIRAANRHDLKGMLSYLTDDFVFRDSASTFRVTKPELLPALQWDLALNSHVRSHLLKTDSESATFVMSERNDFYRLLGLRQQSYRVRFVVREGRIREEVIEEMIKDGPTSSEALAPAVDWARAHQPDTLVKVYRDNQPIYTGETANTWIALLREWRKWQELEALSERNR
jgi:hypothetical protein